ncbi:MucR family transcriptional regulator [Lichenibacterium minor]|uniref:MucR family transcriptional regulator n=1 Tax=Lichenibacterium minor TaxID=2316528 RepID=A0A4Q2U9R3_9HYPH|nr:MucR family transcriptional regulator [Lichenibacterium minor]RYC31901.1 MucR family transcriptional regulator [Lichenibacterium minor]
MSDTPPDLNVVEMAAEIVSAYVRNNSVPVSELPALLQSVHDSLGNILNGAKPEPVKEPPQPKVPVKKSVTNDYIVCLEDGKRFKSLKRHLHSEHGLSPQEYREKWGLAKDYPMVAPAYADARSNLAKTMGLGRKAGTPALESAEPEVEAAEPEPAPAAPEPEPAAAEEPAKKPRRGRAKATA